jgi:hypothetical protein
MQCPCWLTCCHFTHSVAVPDCHCVVACMVSECHCVIDCMHRPPAVNHRPTGPAGAAWSRSSCVAVCATCVCTLFICGASTRVCTSVASAFACAFANSSTNPAGLCSRVLGLFNVTNSHGCVVHIGAQGGCCGRRADARCTCVCGFGHLTLVLLQCHSWGLQLVGRPMCVLLAGSFAPALSQRLGLVQFWA